MKKFRGNGDVTFPSDSLSDVANMRIHAEGFLEDEYSGKRTFFFGTGDECLHRTAVGDRQDVLFSYYIWHFHSFPDVFSASSLG
jgi:hypothetical protein